MKIVIIENVPSCALVLVFVQDVSSRLQILEAQTRKFNLGDDVILLEVARFLPDTVTGSVAIRKIYRVSLWSWLLTLITVMIVLFMRLSLSSLF